MSNKYYYVDNYETKIKSKLIGKDGNYLNFEESLFYLEGGGQPGDIGFIDQMEVLTTDKKGILVKDASPFIVGNEYEQTLNFAHRYKYMKEHSAQHLISAVLFHEEGLHTVSVHLGDEFITIEIEENNVSREKLERVEDKVNFLIREGLDIYAKVMTHKEAEKLNMRRSIKVETDDVRVVYIATYDSVGCAGVHLSNTREIEEVSYLSSESIRGHLRTYWKVGEEAIKEKKLNKSVIRELNKIYSSPTSEILINVEKDKERIKNLEDENKTLCSELADILLSSFEKRENKDNITLVSSLPLVSFNGKIEKYDIKEILIINGNQFLYFGSSNGFAILKEKYKIKGGGREPYFRGQIVSYE